MIQKFRKKPVIIEAVQFTRNNFDEVRNFTNGTAHGFFFFAHDPEGTATCLRLCVCLPLAQGFNLPQMLMGQIAQNRCYTLARLIKR